MFVPFSIMSLLILWIVSIYSVNSTTENEVAPQPFSQLSQLPGAVPTDQALPRVGGLSNSLFPIYYWVYRVIFDADDDPYTGLEEFEPLPNLSPRMRLQQSSQVSQQPPQPGAIPNDQALVEGLSNTLFSIYWVNA
jgi:hypothetical protein